MQVCLLSRACCVRQPPTVYCGALLPILLAPSLVCSPTYSVMATKETVSRRHTPAAASLLGPPAHTHSQCRACVLHAMPANFSCHTESTREPSAAQSLRCPGNYPFTWQLGLRTYGLPGHVASESDRQTAKKHAKRMGEGPLLEEVLSVGAVCVGITLTERTADPEAWRQN